MQNYYYSVDNGLIDDIAKAVNGEYTAITCYGQLANMAPTEEIRDRIEEIRQDEIKHYEIFSQIYSTMTGRAPSPQLVEECAPRYRDALLASFKDEQETVDFYLDIADRSTNPYVREQFKRASKDEQNHAVWFLFYLSEL
ncbi:ferritin-like domain-containing protein [Halobacillus ihumii]|uniref:ferritin-like domain-containing protein n=1 Tax=Halobacillus ihumii TaxID=2686092 RepID=UPI0013CFFEDB|nr:ferritin-like domain-containing protein [Halobacillus ihumii]